MDPVKKSERSGWGEGARGAQAARRAAREPRVAEWEMTMAEAERLVVEDTRQSYPEMTHEEALEHARATEPMTNDQIAEMIVCMTEDEELADVIDRLVHWTTEEWQQCDPERNARQLTINDQYEIIGMVVVKSTQLT